MKSKVRFIFWGWELGWWKLWAFKRNVTDAVLWSLFLGGIEIRRQVIGTWPSSRNQA